MLDHTVPGVKQPNKYSCGAACCLYIMRMLRVAEDDDTVETIMPGLRTIPGFDTFGSSPQHRESDSGTQPQPWQGRRICAPW